MRGASGEKTINHFGVRELLLVEGVVSGGTHFGTYTSRCLLDTTCSAGRGKRSIVS